MAERKQMEGPATVLALAIALVLIAGGVTGLVLTYVPTTDYHVSWVGADAAADEATIAGTGDTKLQLTAPHVMPKAVRVEFPRCSDGFNPNLQQQEAQVSFKLTRSAGTQVVDVASESFTCASLDEDAFVYEEREAPRTEDKVEAVNETEAEKTLRDGMRSKAETVTYTLTVTVTRQAGPLDPIPVGPVQAPFAAEVALVVEEWALRLSEEPEVFHR